ncbi:histidine kinase, partial [Escherichia coli]|nr:histidine kinase [Escherichia coli]
MAQTSSYSELNQYHLGLWYSAYRLIISTGLLLIFLLTYPDMTTDYQYPKLYHYALMISVAVNTVQLFTLRWVKRLIQPQFILIFASDVFFLSLLTLASQGPNVHLGLIFVITIFSASLLLDAKKALIITLIAVISIIYQHFIGSIFAFS